MRSLPPFLLPSTLALALGVGAGCRFDPDVPPGRILCSYDHECPQGMACRPATSGPAAGARVCCQGASCGPSGADADAGTPQPPPAGGAVDAAGDVERVVPPMVPSLPPAAPAPDGGPDATSAAADAGSDAAAASPVTCSTGFNTPIAPQPGTQTYCTIQARDSYLALGIDTISMGDATSIRAHAVCWANQQLAALTTDPNTLNGRALSPGALDFMVSVVEQFIKLCATHDGQMVGAVASRWARQAPNQPDIKTRLKERTGITLDVPTVEQEMRDIYLGVSRNRRKRLVLDGRWASPELMFWPAAAPQPRRYTLPVSYTSASAAYLVNTTYTRFDDARKQLRARLQGDMDATVKEFESLFRTGELEPVVAVGPATALIPLAVGGKLRSPTGVWDEVPVFERKLREATVSPTAHGRIFGLVSPGQIDDLFRSIDDPQFTQLRSDPRRTAYGDELMLMTTLLDVLADEAKASEFAFVFTNPHFGYLFSKVLPPPL